MLWLLIAILAYLILAVVALVDKYLLVTTITNPKLYTFYVGVLGILVWCLTPWVGFKVLPIEQLILSLLSGAFFIYGIFYYYRGIQLYEASAIVPALGSLLPLFMFGLILIISVGQESLSLFKIIAFVLLIVGSALITYQPQKTSSSPKIGHWPSLKLASTAAFFLALSFVLVKYVYLVQPFWPVFIWRSTGGFLVALVFWLSYSEIKKEIFYKSNLLQKNFSLKILIFLTNQAAGAGATILQNWAIFLAPLLYIPFVQALSGLQYVFLFIFSILLSLFAVFWRKSGLKEEISRRNLIQKSLAILLIGLGLALLALEENFLIKLKY